MPGVSRVLFKETCGNHAIFEVAGRSDRAIRGDLARAVVEAGWDLNELRTAAVSLEEIFLQLTNTGDANAESVQASGDAVQTATGKAKE